MATRFYKCNHCGNVIEKVVDSKVPVVCCGEKMQELCYLLPFQSHYHNGCTYRILLPLSFFF